MIEVSAEQMYAEACRALGEAVVRERILSEAVQQLTAERDALAASARADCLTAP